MPTIYEEMKAAGLVQGNRYSDLYVFDTKEAREIIKRHRPSMVDSFKSNVDGARLIEIPLSYDPYWTERGMKPEIGEDLCGMTGAELAGGES